jgi:hypothetical protein
LHICYGSSRHDLCPYGELRGLAAVPFVVRKWTLRLPDEEGETFAEFCRVSGFSIQAGLAAAVMATNQRFIENDRKPPEQWAAAEEGSLGRWLANVEIARNLDAEKRRRAPREPGS